MSERQSKYLTLCWLETILFLISISFILHHLCWWNNRHNGLKYFFTYHKSLLFDILFDFKNRDTVLKAPIYQAFSSVSLLYLKPTLVSSIGYIFSFRNCFFKVKIFDCTCFAFVHSEIFTPWNLTQQSKTKICYLFRLAHNP